MERTALCWWAAWAAMDRQATKVAAIVMSENLSKRRVKWFPWVVRRWLVREHRFQRGEDAVMLVTTVQLPPLPQASRSWRGHFCRAPEAQGSLARPGPLRQDPRHPFYISASSPCCLAAVIELCAERKGYKFCHRPTSRDSGCSSTPAPK